MEEQKGEITQMELLTFPTVTNYSTIPTQWDTPPPSSVLQSEVISQWIKPNKLRNKKIKMDNGNGRNSINLLTLEHGGKKVV